VSTPPIVAVQMDPLDSINPLTDTTLVLCLEAGRRNYRLFHYLPKDLIYQNGKIKASGHFFEAYDDPKNYYQLKESAVFSLDQANYVLIRQDPPFNLAYITTTHLLELLPASTLVVNNPKGIRNAPEKLLVTHFPDLMPPTLITSDVGTIEAFRQEHRDIVIKPLFEYGGRGVMHVTSEDQNLNSLLELYHQLYPEPLMIQRFLPEVYQGDKRILILNGDPVSAYNRKPATGDFRSNMRVGGMPEAYDRTPRDHEICARLKPILEDYGLVFVGIDIIGQYLTEINVTSPTGIRAANRLYHTNLERLFWDVLEKKCNSA